MADRFSAAVKTAFAAIEKKDSKSSTTPATLRLTFGNQADSAADVVVDAQNAGTFVTPTQATKEPQLALAAASATPGTKYLAVSLDPDAPFPSFSFLGPILHGVQANLTAGDAVDGWAPLTSSVAPAVDYIKPGPPSPSAAHRYVFLVYKQPEGVDDSKIREAMGWATEGPAVTRMGRMRFDVGDLEAKLGLGEVVGVNYFESSQ
ncbi:hypothetical protein Sste5346_002255 [Sporothrix stenoceras]|uniref:PEBP-like protein n=1 Tax=Sporothrix stenoceras TaxID=5173 RepID=A0ABR3ZJY0_9PEZI